MMKLITKYNRHILAAMSVLLLVVFLAPTAVTQCGRMDASPSAVWATTADGQKITLGDLADVREQLAVLEVLRDPLTSSLDLAKNPEHWWLLVKEARDAGLVGGPTDGRSFVEEAASSMGRPADQLLAQLSSTARQPQQVVLQALANLRGVDRLIRLTQGAARLSGARQRLGARELLTDVTCDVVPIDAATVGDAVAVPPPTPEQLAATFEKGKSSLAGAGPGGTGYRYPDRFRLEWLAIPSSAIARSLEPDPALGTVELRKEFRRNPSAFGVPAADLGPDKPAPAYEAHAPKVRAEVERRLVKDRIERIASAVRDWNRIVAKDLPSEGGIVKLPADWAAARPALSALAQELQTKFGVEAPIAGGSGEAWLTAAEIDDQPFVGKATTAEFGQATRVSDLVRELRDIKPDGRMPVQAGIVGPVATTPTDDVVIWRVVAADPSHDPEGMGEVIDAVTRDALAQARYDALSARVDEIAGEARKEGLDAVAGRYGTTVQPAPSVHLADPTVLKQYRLRFPGSLPTAGQDKDAIRAVVDKAISLPSGMPTAAVPEQERILAVAVPSRLAVIVARINDVRPLTLESFRDLEASGSIAPALREDEPGPALTEAFGRDALAKRHGFTLTNPDGPDRPVAPEAPVF